MIEKLDRLISILKEMENMVIDKDMYDQLLFLEEDLDDFFEELEGRNLLFICKNWIWNWKKHGQTTSTTQI